MMARPDNRRQGAATRRISGPQRARMPEHFPVLPQVYRCSRAQRGHIPFRADRTTADLDGGDITTAHVAEAIQYRSLDARQ